MGSAHARIIDPTEELLSYEEFLARADEDAPAEWVDGRVVPMSPASSRHQDLCDFLLMLLRAFAEERGAGVVRSAPFQMKTGPDLPGREPDLLFVAAEHADRLQATHLRGPADLAVEIVSPESRLRDRGAKLAEYEMGGVREYWILDPDLEQADFMVLDERDRYERRPPADGVYRSTVLDGFWLEVDWLWRQPLPGVVETLRRLGVL